MTESIVPPFARGYVGFEGTVGRTAEDSTPWWPQPAAAPVAAPNVVVVLIDDMGYSDTGPYGSEIDTPNLDRLARSGVRLSNYHTAPLCSPARAALLTGLNPHRAGYGHVANFDPGFPGWRLELADDVSTLAEILRGSGYATYAVGKWHLVRDHNMAPGRPRDSWPLQRGFDRYYGSLEGLNSFFYPNQLIADNSVVDVEQYPEGYYVTDDLTDRAIGMIKDLRAHDAGKPFFLYFAHIAMHGPLQAKEIDLAKYRGRYAAGWDRIREARFARQLADGLFPPGTRPAPRNHEPGYDVAPWESLGADRQRRFARYMEVYAAMVDSIDQSLGRILKTLEDLGEADNTIVVFTSDNGGTAEGGPEGTRSYLGGFLNHPAPADWERDVPHDEALIGSARLGVHYPRGWGQTSNTPFRFYKGQTFAGGVRVPFVLSWPEGLPRNGGDDGIRRQYAYVTDLTPTLLDLIGVEAPTRRQGLPVQDFDGVSIVDVLRSSEVDSPHTEQYAEMGGHRGYYRDGWKLLTLYDPAHDVDDPRWELYDIRVDPAEIEDLAGEYPEKVAELAEAWDRAAWRNTVFPLSGGGPPGRRRPAEDVLGDPIRILSGTPTLERYRASKLIQYRDFAIDIDLGGYVPGDEGVLVAHGDPQGGYLLYVEDRELRVVVNSYGRLASAGGPIGAGVRSVLLRVDATAGLRWNLTTEVDGIAVAKLDGVVALAGMVPWTGISVGVDARGPVSWELRGRRGPFPYTGDLRSVTYTPGPLRVAPELIGRIEAVADSDAD